MSMFPFYPRGNEWWMVNRDPAERLFDQFFGEPMMSDAYNSPSAAYQNPMAMLEPYYLRPTRRAMNRAMQELGTGFSDVMNDPSQFGVRMDVSHFKPDELKVTTQDNQVVITGDHTEKPDEHGMVERHFVRKYNLPKGCNAESVTSQLSTDGVLTVTAPKQAIEGPKGRTVPITAGPASTGAKKPAVEGDKTNKMNQQNGI